MLQSFKKIQCKSGRLLPKSDRDLILEFQKGDLTSFSSLYSRFYRPLLKYVLNQVKTVHVAEELAQDIFLKVYQYRDSYNPEYEASTWIWTIARNTVYDYLRRHKTSVSAMGHQTSESNLLGHEPVSNETAETIIIEGLEKQKLLNLMTALSSKQKEAIFLRMVKKFSYQEISHSMNLSLSAVKSLINRGKNSLMKLNSELYTT